MLNWNVVRVFNKTLQSLKGLQQPARPARAAGVGAATAGIIVCEADSAANDEIQDNLSSQS